MKYSKYNLFFITCLTLTCSRWQQLYHGILEESCTHQNVAYLFCVVFTVTNGSQCDAFLYVDRCCLVMLCAVQLYACQCPHQVLSRASLIMLLFIMMFQCHCSHGLLSLHYATEGCRPMVTWLSQMNGFNRSFRIVFYSYVKD